MLIADNESPGPEALEVRAANAAAARQIVTCKGGAHEPV